MECKNCHRPVFKTTRRGRPKTDYCNDKCYQAYRRKREVEGRKVLELKGRPRKPRAPRTTALERLEAEASAAGTPDMFPAGAIARARGGVLVQPSVAMLSRVARELGLSADRTAEMKRLEAIERDMADEKVDLFIPREEYEEMLQSTRRLLGL